MVGELILQHFAILARQVGSSVALKEQLAELQKLGEANLVLFLAGEKAKKAKTLDGENVPNAAVTKNKNNI